MKQRGNTWICTYLLISAWASIAEAMTYLEAINVPELKCTGVTSLHGFGDGLPYNGYTQPQIISIYRTLASEIRIHLRVEDAAGSEIFSSLQGDPITLAGPARRLEPIQGPQGVDDEQLSMEGSAELDIPRSLDFDSCAADSSECNGFALDRTQRRPSERTHYPPRRGKGVGGGTRTVTASGGTAAASFSSRRGGGSYGYSTTGLGSRYSMGHRSTGYGYTGTYPRGRIFFFPGNFMLMRGYGGGGRYNRETQDDDQGEHVVAMSFNGDLTQDDIMVSGFVPNQFTFPLTFFVYDTSSLSTVPEYDLTSDQCADMNSTPADYPNIFVSLAPVEYHQEETDFWSTDGGIALFSFLIICPTCCLCAGVYMMYRDWQSKMQNRVLAEEQNSAPPVQLQNFAQQPVPVGLVNQAVCEPHKPDYPNPAARAWKSTPNGSTGESIVVVGKPSRASR